MFCSLEWREITTITGTRSYLHLRIFAGNLHLIYFSSLDDDEICRRIPPVKLHLMLVE